MPPRRWTTPGLTSVLVAVLMVAPVRWFTASAQSSRYFVVRVVDEETNRGVPLVKVKPPNDVKYWTDSAGVAALDEPSLRGRETFLAVRSHAGLIFCVVIHLRSRQKIRSRGSQRR